MGLKTHSLAIAIVLLSGVGCGGSSNDTPAPSNDPTSPVTPGPNPPNSQTPPVIPPSDTSAIAALWDVTEANDDGLQDISYALISIDGHITVFDYEQDAAGDGRNCYSISSSTLVALGNNQYSQSDEQEGGIDNFTAVKNGHLLTVTFVDVDDDNGNGDTTDLFVATYPELVGIDPRDLTDCSAPIPPLSDPPVVTNPPTGPYVLGESGPAGGTIFYLSDDGITGIEAAPENLPPALWGCLGTDIPGAEGKAIGDGAQNTLDIINAGCGADTAASVAAAYAEGGYTDWFLPSIDTLTLMIRTFRAADPFGEVFRIDDYWSSTEDGANFAWDIYALAGAQNLSVGKSGAFLVRPVRAF